MIRLICLDWTQVAFMRQTYIDLCDWHGSVISVKYRFYHKSTLCTNWSGDEASTANGQTPRYIQCSINLYLLIYRACYPSSASVGMEISLDVIEWTGKLLWATAHKCYYTHHYSDGVCQLNLSLHAVCLELWSRIGQSNYACAKCKHNSNRQQQKITNITTTTKYEFPMANTTCDSHCNFKTVAVDHLTSKHYTTFSLVPTYKIK